MKGSLAASVSETLRRVSKRVVRRHRQTDTRSQTEILRTEFLRAKPPSAVELRVQLSVRHRAGRPRSPR